MKYVAMIALLAVAACSGPNGYASDATNYAPSARGTSGAWTGQEPYSPSQYAL